MARCGSLNRSVQELKNRNNLATIRLSKELAEHDRRKKYSMKHIDKCRVDAYTFLKQLHVCNSNLVPAYMYRELLDDVGTRPVGTRRLCNLDKALDLKHDLSSSEHQGQQLHQHKSQVISKVTKAHLQLVQIRNTHHSNQERVELFLDYLRERKEKTVKQQTEIGLETKVTPATVSRYTSFNLLGPSTESSGEKWDTKRSTGFYSLERLNVAAGGDDELGDCGIGPNLVPTLTQTFPGVSHPVKESMVKVSSPEPPLPTRRAMVARLRDFYASLDKLKREQDERLAGAPLWEKRRRWLQLTKGEGDGIFGEEAPVATTH